MKITVETKFNIGDMVYTPEPSFMWIATTEPSKVNVVMVECHVNNDGEMVPVIFYDLSNELFPCRETMCFATLEECKQWCLEQNEKDGVL